MPIEERKTINTGVIQNLILENRGKLSISGVNDVLNCWNWIRIAYS